MRGVVTTEMHLEGGRKDLSDLASKSIAFEGNIRFRKAWMSPMGPFPPTRGRGRGSKGNRILAAKKRQAGWQAGRMANRQAGWLAGGQAGDLQIFSN